MNHLLTLTVACSMMLFTIATQAENHYEADVVVYGGTAAGVIAAIAAADAGSSVVLYEPKKHLGGMVTGGLGRTDYAKKYVIGGMSREFFERNGTHYDKEIEWFLEPHVAENIYNNWLREAGVLVVNNHPGKFVTAVKMDAGRIQGFACGDGLRFSGTIFIDASYEGDLLALAGISYTVGREGQEVYSESLAGQIEYSPKHQFLAGVSPRDDDNEVSALIQGSDPKTYGQGDKKVQAYNFRICMTNVADNLVPWPKPEGYEPRDWDLLARYLEAVPGLPMNKLMAPGMMPNGKTDTNNNGAISTDYIGESWGYPEGTPAERAAIWEKHKRYNQGFLYFLANDPRVPEALQTEMNQWGLAKDEFVDNDHWPHQLYVREARRMIGTYVMQQKDLQTERTKEDSIGMGSYNSDSHHVQRYVVSEAGPWGDEVPMVINEGDMQVAVRPYEIAYRSLTPKSEECTNLLSVSTVSASHVAYSSIRMEPQYMIMGEAAGVAAAHAIEQDCAVQAIDVPKLQAVLLAQGAVLSLDDVDVPYASKKKLPGIVLDDDDADLYGNWRISSSTDPYIGLGYAHEVTAGSGLVVATYRPNVPATGQYEVFVSYSPYGNRCQAAKYTIHHADGVKTIVIDQRTKPHKEENPLVSLGTYTFAEGRSGWLKVKAQPGAEGYLVVDAAQWLPVGAAQEAIPVPTAP